MFYKNPVKSLLSYNDDWQDAFTNESIFDIETCNLATKKWLLYIPKIAKFDLIIFLHSSNSNSIAIHPWLAKSLNYRKGKVVFFVGNEYKLIPEKITLIKKISADFIVSQLPQDTAEWLYEDCEFSKIISLPHALNAEVFKSKIKIDHRRIDIGVRAYEYPWYLGDRERMEIFGKFQNETRHELNLDIELNPQKRFDRSNWSEFLNTCKGTVSTEAGTSYLERTDQIRKKVNSHMNKFPDSSFEEIFEIFFKNYENSVSGKCISPRHFDAIGTKTCQIMFKGRFNDILQPDKHYISLNRDFSNYDDVVGRFKDLEFCSKMVDETHEYIMDSHTHRHRIKELIDLI